MWLQISRSSFRMAGAMDMAAKLPKIRDEEREQRVSRVDIVMICD